MSFASPWMLAGLLAIGIPVWLHFRQRRRTAVPFPATALLAKVAQRRRRRFEVRLLALLIARILVITSVVLAAARPGIVVVRPGGIRSGSALALVIVLDDSLSMRLSGDGGATLFDAAKKAALAELSRLRPGDAAALILSGHPVRAPVPVIDYDLVRMRLGIESAKPSFLEGDIKTALRQASRILEESPLPQREVVVISDLQEGRDEEWPPWSPASGIGFRVIDSGPDVDRDNVSVGPIEISASPEGIASEIFIEVQVANHGAKPLKDFDVILELDGEEVSRSSIQLPPQGASVKRFLHRFEKDGIHRGAVRIRKDRLPADDIRHFSVSIRQAISVLVINGDYRPGSYRDEAFYLQRALETPIAGEVNIQPVVVDEETAQAGPIFGHDVIFLAGVGSLSPTLAGRLVEYVQRGGGLFVAPASTGGSLDLLDAVLPTRIRSIRQASEKARPFRIGAIDRTHPLFAPFGSGQTGLEKTEITAHLLVEPEPSADRSTLMALAGGLPLLLERRVNRGTVMLFGTTLDRDWSDLPIRPGYLPLVQRATRHLAGRLDDHNPRSATAGHPVQIEVSQGMQRLVVREPDGKDVTYPAVELADKPAIAFTDTWTPGHYQVWTEIPGFGGLRELPFMGFLVETNPSESDLRRVVTARGAGNPGSLAPVKGSFPIWPHLLIAGLLLLLLETWLAGYGLRRSHLLQRKAPVRRFFPWTTWLQR